MNSVTKHFLVAAFVTFVTLPASVTAAEATEFEVAGLKFVQPASWKKIQPTSSMRKAQLEVAGKDGKKAEVVFFYFGPGGAGGVKANVDRWLGQFQEPREKINARVEDKRVGKTRITYVHALGTYLSGMPGGAKTSQADTVLLGAIVEGPEGFIFVKMTGHKSVVQPAEKDFNAMIETRLK